MAKKRAPYSYIKQSEAPPIGLYRPKFKGVEPYSTRTNFDTRICKTVDKRVSHKPVPACVIVGRDACSLVARQKVTENDPVRQQIHKGLEKTLEAPKDYKRPASANQTAKNTIKADKDNFFMTSLGPLEDQVQG